MKCQDLVDEAQILMRYAESLGYITSMVNNEVFGVWRKDSPGKIIYFINASPRRWTTHCTSGHVLDLNDPDSIPKFKAIIHYCLINGTCRECMLKPYS